MISQSLQHLRRLTDTIRSVDFVGPLALRLYLVPVFWVAGMNKATGFGDVVEWFGNPDWGLGLPAPALMAFLATAAEVGGALLLLLGLGTRLATVPLMATMIVAAVTVHSEHGWQAVHDSSSPFASRFTLGLETGDASAAGERLERARAILQEHGHYEWLTEQGHFIVSNSGIEWAATYFVMLLALFCSGGGRYLSLDHWIERRRAARAAGLRNGGDASIRLSQDPSGPVGGDSVR
jgi:putative oxidoreductase